MTTTNFMILEHQPIVRDSLCRRISAMPDARVTHATGSWRDLRSRLDNGDRPDLILMDPYSKAEVGYRVIMQLRA
ncbi:hypothetical protein ABTU78_20010, partial [Acinetobacter baumannii]